MGILKRLHTSVAQTFERTFDDAYKDLQAELSRHDTRATKAECARSARFESAIEIEKLERQVALLREELHGNNGHSEDFETSLTPFLKKLEETYSPRHVFSDNDSSSDWKPDEREVKIILDKYIALYSDARTLVGASGKLKEQVKRQKRKLSDWQDRLHRDEFTVVIDGIPVKFQRVRSTAQNIKTAEPTTSTPALLEQEAIGPGSIPIMPRSGSLSSGRLHKTVTPPAHGYIECNAQPPPDLDEPTELSSTQSDSTAASDALIKDANDFDVSGKVQSGALKRRGTNLQGGPSKMPNCRHIQETELGEHSVVIESENMSSSPHRKFSQLPGITGTQDLDEVGSTVETPTKGTTCMLYRRLGAAPLGITSPPDRQEYQSQIAGRNHTRRPQTLRPIDGNLRSIRSRCSHRAALKNSEPTIKDHDISSVTEDGDKYQADCSVINQTGDSSPGKNLHCETSGSDSGSMSRRLHDLLETPLSARRPLGLPSSVFDNAKDVQSPTSLPMEETVNSYSAYPITLVPQTAHPWRSEPQALKATHPCLEAEPDYIRLGPEDEPYRARPLHRLQASHFKINPDHNQGLDFAFGAVVRKRDERKHLTNCTRKGCCGDHFRAMARLDSQRPSPEEEQQILEEYLGEDRDLLVDLPEGERLDLLHEAQARRMAKSFGKHRHQHQRPGTPPGFWRTDMPDTQELERDWEQARVAEREKVKERYREAMRPGGLWRFADE